jgi:acetyl-CoA/propionyl-CoA carboxylase biotin carboxyl carrier protein
MGVVFERVLIANRGEIAVRVIRTLRRLGVTSVAVYSDADRHAPHVQMADEAVPLGDARCYLDAPRLVATAIARRVDAVHPGYGFLSENAAFARACTEAGLVFVGPPAGSIEMMGDKINAKRTVAASGVPVVPGRDEAGLDDRRLAAAAVEIGFPVLIKPSAGGGGKGMRLVESEAELATQLQAARREAQGAFGDDTLLVERYVARPRHIEMQVFADGHGTCVALGERECSLQRRHQKIVEEAPSPLLDPATRAAMADSAVAAARSCGYVGAGTVEFIVSADRPDEYFFMEMNTRLQVEHPVTEAVLGLDLVELQLRVAAGERLPWASQSDVPAPSGHAVEARVYAEDPGRGFLPASGPVLVLREPAGGDGVRVDSGIREGMEVGTLYDPMLSKVIAWGPDRRAALRRLDGALGATTVLGVTTNVGFLRRLIRDPAVVEGELDTGLVERRAPALSGSSEPGRGVPDPVLAAAGLLARALDGPGPDPWSGRDGWRVGDHSPRRTRWGAGPAAVDVEISGDRVTVGGRPLGDQRAELAGDTTLVVEGAAERAVYTWSRHGDDLWMGRDGDAWKLTEQRRVLMHRTGAAAGSGRVTSPMPGTVLDVRVQPGSAVEAGQQLVVVEAMKMEHTVLAPAAGTVTEVLVQAGQSVRLDQPLVVIEEREEES